MDLSNLLGDNQLLQGGFVLMLAGALLAYARNVPRSLLSLAKRRFSVTLQLRDPVIVSWLGQWLAESQYAKRCRLLNVWVNQRDTQASAVLEPGLGVHVFRHGGRWVVFSHSLEDKGTEGNPFIKLPASLKLGGIQKNCLDAMILGPFQCERTAFVGKHQDDFSA